MSVDLQSRYFHTDGGICLRGTGPIEATIHDVIEIKIQSRRYDAPTRFEHLTISVITEKGEEIEISAFGKIGLMENITKINEPVVEPEIDQGEAA